MGPMVVVVILPLPELVIEDLASSMTVPIQEPIELLGVDPMTSLDLSIESGRPRLDVAVTDPLVEDVVVE